MGYFVLYPNWTYWATWWGHWNPNYFPQWAYELYGGENVVPPPYTEFPSQPDADSIGFPEFRIHKGIPPDAMSMEYNSGWNFVSTPFIEHSGAPRSQVWPDSTPSSLYGFNGTYEPTNEVVPGQGYWLNFPSATTQLLHGTSLVPEVWGGGTPDSTNSMYIHLNEGYNLIGVPGGVCSLSDPTAVGWSPEAENIWFWGNLNEGDIIIPGTIHEFDGTYNAVNPDQLQSGHAYWIRAYMSGDVFFRREG
jgi:hypothetical protein